MMNRFSNIDCFEGIKSIEDNSVDLILEDMPYNITACDWDVKIDLGLYWETRLRILKPTGLVVLTASQPFTSELVMSNNKMFKYEWIWDKGRPTGVLNSRYSPMKKHENILVFYIKVPTYNPILRTKRKQDIRDNGKLYKHTNNGAYGDVLKSSVLNQFREIPVDKKYPDSVLEIQRVGTFGFEKTGHPTQKPVELFEYLIRTYTNEGDLVFDGFAGSGTTGIACEKSNRDYIMFEKEKKYFDAAQKRLTQFRSQLKLAI